MKNVIANSSKKDIPKVIHYCWFGKKPIPTTYKDYMKSWLCKCPGFEIKEWNEKNFDISANQYCKEAYSSGKWAFMSDYARLKLIYDYGGIYLDTDVEIIKDLTPLINDGIGFIGFQNDYEVNTGLGFAAAPGSKIIKAMLDFYENRHFIIEDGKYNTIPCPAANSVVLIDSGLNIGPIASKEVQQLDEIKVYPEEFFNPMNYDTHRITITKNTYTIHHYAGSWNKGGRNYLSWIKRIFPSWYLQARTRKIAFNHFECIRKEQGRFLNERI